MSLPTPSTEEEAASVQVEQILGATKPKHIGEGAISGIGYIVKGAVGAVGVAVLTPAIAAAEGTKEMGIVGGVIGGVGGVVGGAIGAVNMLGGGIVTGVSQVVQGAVATPKAMMAPSQGKWWNANEGAWVSTNLLDEERWVLTQPKHDEDILGEDVIPEDERNVETTKEGGGGTAPKKKKVKDMYYYDKLGLDPAVANAEMVKRRYYIIARKFSPDRCGANPEANEEFQQIGHAYMVLSNDELRAKYDRVGREGLWKEEEADCNEPDVDPYLLYSFLFGSEKFSPYVGRLAAASAARVGEQETKLSIQQARLLQKRRVTRLALLLSERLSKYAEEGIEQSARALWMTEAEDLCDASYGVELVHVIGKVYTLAAVQFLGSLESGVGMPSIGKWAESQVKTLQENTKRVSNKITKNAMPHANDKVILEKNVSVALDKADGDAQLETVAKDILKESFLQSKAVHWLWTQTVVDITNTLHEVIQMVLNDANVSAEIRKKRAKGLEIMGKIFETSKGTGESNLEQEGFEEVAFHAMLDTVWRQEKAYRKHYYQTTKVAEA